MTTLAILVAIAIVCQISATPSSSDYSDSGPDHSGSEDLEHSEEGSPEITSYRQGGGGGGGWHRGPGWGPHHGFHGGFHPGSHRGFNPHSGYHPGPHPGRHPGPHPGRHPGPHPESDNTSKNNSSHQNETKEEQITTCIKACPVTTELKPVCGTNNVTYPNPGRLQCEQQCGIDVQISRQTACSESTIPHPSHEVIACVWKCPVTTENNPVCGSNNVTYSNLARLLCEQACGVPVELKNSGPCTASESTTKRPKTPEDQIACVKSCPVTGEYNPVCGSNNVTYPNPGKLECARFCGIDVTLRRKSPCGGSEVTSTTEKVPTDDESIAACMKSCPVTPEYNPVCGSNNVTYNNPGRLECAKHCGVDVTLTRKSPCGRSEVTSTTEKVPTDDESIAACMKSCPVTPEYNPVCGSNNVTYNNPGRLECAKHCGVDVTLRRKSPCGGSGIVSTTEKVSTSDESIAACMRSCPVTSEYNPVCGSNNVTYTNPGRLECAQYCGVAVTITRRTTCEVPLPDKPDRNNGNKTNEGNGNDGNGDGKGRPDGWNENHENYKCYDTINRKPPSLEQLMKCMQTCSLTSEYNPVCGSDLITYMNPGRLLCAQFCGVGVQVKKFAPCNSDILTNVDCPTTCTDPPVTKRPDPIVPPLEVCMESCPSSTENSPVCGSNNITYRNLDRLHCAKRCGIDVTMKRTGHCSVPEVPLIPKDNATRVQECVRGCSVLPKHEPVCGTDNVTYNSKEHLKCAKQCGLNVEIAQSRPCSNVTPPTGVTTEKVPEPEGNGIHIDPDILGQIWGTTTPKDEDEDFDIDHRNKDKQ